MKCEFHSYSTSTPPPPLIVEGVDLEALLGEGIVGWENLIPSSAGVTTVEPYGSVALLENLQINLNPQLNYLHYRNDVLRNTGNWAPILLGGTPNVVRLGKPLGQVELGTVIIIDDSCNYIAQCEDPLDLTGLVVMVPSSLSLQWSEIEARYKISEPQETRAIIEENAVVMAALQEIPDKLNRHFGTYNHLKLSVLEDPDATNYIQVLIEIVTEAEPEQAYEHLLNFRENWWLDVNPEARKMITMNLAYL